MGRGRPCGLRDKNRAISLYTVHNLLDCTTAYTAARVGLCNASERRPVWIGRGERSNLLEVSPANIPLICYTTIKLNLVLAGSSHCGLPDGVLPGAPRRGPSSHGEPPLPPVLLVQAGRGHGAVIQRRVLLLLHPELHPPLGLGGGHGRRRR